MHLENPEYHTRWYFKYFLGQGNYVLVVTGGRDSVQTCIIISSTVYEWNAIIQDDIIRALHSEVRGGLRGLKASTQSVLDCGLVCCEECCGGWGLMLF